MNKWEKWHRWDPLDAIVTREWRLFGDILLRQPRRAPEFFLDEEQIEERNQKMARWYGEIARGENPLKEDLWIYPTNKVLKKTSRYQALAKLYAEYYPPIRKGEKPPPLFSETGEYEGN